MDIYVLDTTFNKIGVIDYCSSVIWTTRYCAAGDFELYLPATSEALSLLKVGHALVRADKPESLMIISSIQITTNEETGNYLTVSGKSSEGMIEKRIVWKQTNLSGLVTTCVQRLLNENLISPEITARKMPNIEMGDCCECDISMTKQVTGDNLLDAIIEILSTYHLGFKFVFTNKKLKFCIYSGVDRSTGQKERPRVEFSPEFDNLLASDYKADTSNYKNVALVAGEGEGVNRKTYTVGNASGLDRIELFVDARNISSETDDGTLTPTEYNQLLAAQGTDKLSETVIQQSFESTIDPGINYTFGVDYNLGDIVQITNEYGISAAARITEVIESWSETGYSCIPTFSSEEV